MATRSVEPYRLAPDEATPRIDGYLIEGVWSRAAVIDEFHQVEPGDHAVPSEQTRVHVAFDPEFIYIGAVLHDRTPERIAAKQLIQGESINSDDRFDILLDTFDDDRNAFFFQINPNGVRREALLGPNFRLEEWDGIWYAAARITPEGWIAEIAIPLKTLTFSEGGSTWGINFTRTIPRNGEVIAWSSLDRRTGVPEAGRATGLSDLRQGLGLDVVPGVVLTRFDDRMTGDTDTTLEPELNLFYRIRPALTAALTFNTDFSATEPDAREVNLTRFELFFPEKRDFFLEDATVFEFGGLQRNARPFFSRRIGLTEDGEPIDIEAGAKLTGRAGPWRLGLLAIRQDSAGELPGQDLFVARVAADVLDESTVGVILTDGNPTGTRDNRVYGADLRFRDSHVFGDQRVEADLWFLHADTEGLSGDEDAFGAAFRYPNDRLELELGAAEIQSDYRPAVGFLNRRGVREYNASARFRHRPASGPVRFIAPRLSWERIDDIESGLESENITARLQIAGHAGDGANVERVHNREVLEESFEISPGIVIPTGAYRFDRHRVSIETSEHRTLQAALEFEDGEFFNGERRTWRPGLTWRPSRHYIFALQYEHNRIELPAGAFSTRLARFRANIAFNAEWAWLNFLQYDSVSDTGSVNSRLRWIPVAGQEVFLVLNQGFAVEEDDELRSLARDLTFKAIYTLRF